MADENDIRRAKNIPIGLSDKEEIECLIDDGMSDEDAFLSIVCANILNKAREEDIKLKIQELEELERKAFGEVK